MLLAFIIQKSADSTPKKMSFVRSLIWCFFKKIKKKTNRNLFDITNVVEAFWFSQEITGFVMRTFISWSWIKLLGLNWNGWLIMEK